MNRMTFQQVESLFETAIAFEPHLRVRFLEEVARDHSHDVYDMLQRLLECDRSDTRWTSIGSPLVGSLGAPDAVEPGTIIGRFRLLQRLGVGGHGEVYLADQLEPVKRRVALKMLRVGDSSEQVIARFRAEEQALALMNHPNIAKVYEAGLADQGRLYFAMEYVHGQPIDAYCDERRLTVQQRLGLFLNVCHGVQHAHQRGLIHRDLKPTNILVTERDGQAVPVLIDFGIAVATSSGSPGDQGSGVNLGAMGTPAYMSPEQAGPPPRDIDTRSDIYALGVVLYELLTGWTPLDVLAPPGSSLAEIRRCIVECAGPRPAALLASREKHVETAAFNRHVPLARLLRQVAGDLDAIASHAIARDRNDRYQTVEALAHDVENHLRHRPVSVMSVGSLGRARRFIRRHRLMVGALAAVFAAVTFGAVGTTIAMLRAKHSAHESRSVNAFLHDLLTSSRPLEKGASVSFVEVLQSGSAMAGERLASHPQQEGEVRYLLGSTFHTLALYREAQAELETAYRLLRSSRGMDYPNTLHAANLLAMTLTSQHRLDQAQALAEEVRVFTDGKPPPLCEHHLAARRILLDVLSERGDSATAEDGYRELIQEIDAELGAEHAEAYSARMGLLQSLRRQAAERKDLELGRRRFDDETALLEETVRLQKSRFGAEDALPLLTAQLKLGEILVEQRRFAEAQVVIGPILPRIRERFGTGHWMFASAAVSLAAIEYARGNVAEAADHRLAALHAWRAIYPAEHPITLGGMRDCLPYLDAAGRIEEGLREARALFDAVTRLLGREDVISLEARGWVARFASRNGLLDEADEHFASFDKYERLMREHPTGAYIMLFHAGHLTAQERFEEAEAELMRLCERQEGVTSGVNVAHTDDIARMFVELYTAWGKSDKAEEYRQVVKDIWSRSD
jgi:non-specific serine/threonine protein kinase/serine/threonine-protein kinase